MKTSEKSSRAAHTTEGASQKRKTSEGAEVWVSEDRCLPFATGDKDWEGHGSSRNFQEASIGSPRRDDPQQAQDPRPGRRPRCPNVNQAMTPPSSPESRDGAATVVEDVPSHGLRSPLVLMTPLQWSRVLLVMRTSCLGTFPPRSH